MSAEFFEALGRVAGEQSRLADERAEKLVRRVAATYLPRRLRWLLDHPKLLKVAYRLWPRWRPTLYIGSDVGADGKPRIVAAIRDVDGVLHTTSTL